MDNMIKISELQKAYPLDGNDVFIVNQENPINKALETRYTTADDVSKYIEETIQKLLDIQIPVGCIKLYAGKITQFDKLDGWLLCNGQTVSRIKYKRLYEILGSTYGPVTSDTFTLPNLKGKIPMGYCGINNNEVAIGEILDPIMLGSTGGAYTQVITKSQMPVHSHKDLIGHTHDYMDLTKFSWWKNDGGTNSATTPQNHEVFAEVRARKAGKRNPKYDEKTTASTIIQLSNEGGNMPHNNVQPFLSLNYIIKY